jgi:hypothetical protein
MLEGKETVTDVYIDRTTGKKSIIKANYCYYCDKDTYPKGRFLDINDKRAQKTERGDWKCGDCLTEDRVKMAKNCWIYGPICQEVYRRGTKEGRYMECRC